MSDERKAIIFRARYNTLFRLGERFPQVERIQVNYKSKSGSWKEYEKEGTWEILPEQLLDILVECPNSTCTGIGIDLTPETVNAIYKGITRISGTKECKNWEDDECFGIHICGSIVSYEIIITYRKSTP